MLAPRTGVYGQGILLGIVGETAGSHAVSIARCPVGATKLVGVGLGVVVAHQPHVVDAGAEGRAAGREADDKLRLALGKLGRNGILHVVESVLVAALERRGYGNVGQLHAVDGERSVASTVGQVEAEHDAEVRVHTTIII